MRKRSSMKAWRYRCLIGLLVGGAAAAAGLVMLVLRIDPPPHGSSRIDRSLPAWAQMSTAPKIRSSSSPKGSVESKKARWEYFFRLLRDPATNAIPPNIRQRELAHAQTLLYTPQTSGVLQQSQAVWREVDIDQIGGRTRALAFDVRNAQIVLAGGVNGGIWKSIDSGTTWAMQSGNTPTPGVTSLAQDPTNPDTWYYSTGEFIGSAVDRGFRALVYGTGIYQSIDNGETWSVLESTENTDVTFNSPFDYGMRIVVTPQGTVLYASNGFGIYRSTDGGTSFESVLSGDGNPTYSDVTVASDGTVLAAISTSSVGVDPTSTGIFRSTDDGQTWTNITPWSFPQAHDRSVIGLSPSNPEVGYILTFTGDLIPPPVGTARRSREDVRFHKITSIADGMFEDQTRHLPDFEDRFNAGFGALDTQSSYNMVVAVKPDDDHVVLIGGTSLFRSTDGMASNGNTAWVGGYHPSEFVYPNQHPDQHSFAFDPTDPKVLWMGHDGGLSRTVDVTTTLSDETPVQWEAKNDGYNVVQYYHMSLPKAAGDDRSMGGTQDNGTPYLRWNSPCVAGQSADASSGDGAFSYFGSNYFISSSQLGSLILGPLNVDGDPFGFQSGDGSFGYTITPPETSGQLFINPVAVDPSNEQVLFYPAGNALFRNTNITVTVASVDEILGAWRELTNLPRPDEMLISALTVSEQNPSHVLYFGFSPSFGSVRRSQLFRLEKAAVAVDGAEERSSGDWAPGAYIHAIAVNPNHGNELLVVLSNYNIVGLYHSLDGGQTYTAVEGNLTGDDQNPGPSLRWASILPQIGTTVYYVATSTGLYRTSALNGDSTQWQLEGKGTIGNTVVANVTSRPSDGVVVAATHGRGMFIRDPQGLQLTGTSISGFVFSDNNNDGEFSVDDFVISDNRITVFLDTNTNGTLDANEVSQVARYCYEFTHLEPGTYTVEVDVPVNFQRSFPSGLGVHTVVVSEGDQITGKNFGLSPRP